MISYVNKDGNRCLRLGSDSAGVQICFGYFSLDRPCSVALNGNSTVYTGKGETASFNGFPSPFSEAPLAVATPYTGKYWFGNVSATASSLSRLDFFMNEKHTRDNMASVGGNYIVIGKYGSADVAKISNALTASDVRAYWKKGSNVIRIRLPENDDYAIQLISGSISGTSNFAKMNSSLYRAAIHMETAETYAEAFTGFPVMVVTPSMKCRNWGDSAKFSHPYWFGGVNADNERINELDVYSNTELKSQSIYGRYIAVGRSSTNITGWTEVPVSLEYDTAAKAYTLRFGNEEGGMQLAFGEINFKDRKIQKKLNDVDSSIYTAFKEAPQYKSGEAMYFPKAFCESPSTMIMTAKPCRDDDDKTFLHPYWFGDAASDAVSIFNTDLYTNKAFTTDQDVYAKYLAVGQYSAKSDWARPFILKALSYKGVKAFGADSPQKHFLDRYDEVFNHTRKADNGWCSEFASVVLHEAMQAPINEYPYSTYVKGFITKFTYPTGSSSTDTSTFYLGTYDQKTQKTAFHLGKIDPNYNEHTYYHYGDRTNAGNDLRFSCTELNLNDVTPQIGDLIFFGHSKTCHTGIVINVNGSHIFTVEGNVDEDQLGIGTSTQNTVLHTRRKISADASDSNRDRVVGIGDAYAWHLAQKETQASA